MKNNLRLSAHGLGLPTWKVRRDGYAPCAVGIGSTLRLPLGG
jgi:hypothetical protein